MGLSDLASLELVRVSLRLRHPHVAAHGTEVARDVILVGWTRPDGATGWGECPTLSTFGYAEEITPTAWAFLRDVVGPALVEGQLPVVEGAPMAMGAVLDARLDARLVAEGRRLVDHLGASDAPRPICTVVGLDSPLAEGDGPVKVKVTPRTVDRLRTLREEHPDRAMAVDANGSFGNWDDVPAWLADLDLLYVEQPLPPGDLEGHVRLRDRLGVRVCLDESVCSPRDLARAIAADALDVLNVKPARVGGQEVAARLVGEAAGSGCRVLVGGMLETAVGRAGALAVAGLPGVDLPTDLGPSSRYFELDVAHPVELDGSGRLPVPPGPGCGVVPDPARLAGVSTDRVVLSRGL